MDVVDILLFAPCDEVDEHLFCLLKVEFPRSQKPQQIGVIIWGTAQTHCCHNLAKLVQIDQLFL